MNKIKSTLFILTLILFSFFLQSKALAGSIFTNNFRIIALKQGWLIPYIGSQSAYEGIPCRMRDPVSQEKQEFINFCSKQDQEFVVVCNKDFQNFVNWPRCSDRNMIAKETSDGKYEAIDKSASDALAPTTVQAKVISSAINSKNYVDYLKEVEKYSSFLIIFLTSSIAAVTLYHFLIKKK